jgi:hypothetical protein
VRLYCADDWAAYVEAATHGIERDHSRQRHWLARFRRRACVVARAVRMVDASIALLVRFGGRRGTDEPWHANRWRPQENWREPLQSHVLQSPGK